MARLLTVPQPRGSAAGSAAGGQATTKSVRAEARFLAVVAAARRNFLVVEQRNAAIRDYVAVYQFDRAAAEAILACRQRHGA
ncbi:MAG: hypothetical protein EPO55_14040 [Reyranella sp.]|uniref:hypothetical protein n=1 Tax=Reyranella sp. TaxID=1929291 RepID=UPI001210D062|nr:hypothetical protein [Reyranella sp.]TAJ38896.1 MAG: hypothetical protein EPO55_14040 [Reyranella sp.]